MTGLTRIANIIKATVQDEVATEKRRDPCVYLDNDMLELAKKNSNQGAAKVKSDSRYQALVSGAIDPDTVLRFINQFQLIRTSVGTVATFNNKIVPLAEKFPSIFAMAHLDTGHANGAVSKAGYEHDTNIHTLLADS